MITTLKKDVILNLAITYEEVLELFKGNTLIVRCPEEFLNHCEEGDSMCLSFAHFTLRIEENASKNLQFLRTYLNSKDKNENQSP